MAAISQATILSRKMPQLFPKTKAPSTYLECSFSHRHLEAQRRLLASPLNMDSRRVLRVVSKQLRGSLNDNVWLPSDSEAEASYKPRNKKLFPLSSQKPMVLFIKKLIHTGLMLILICLVSNFVFSLPKHASALTAKAIKIEIISYLKTSPSLQAFGLVFLCKTLAIFSPVTIIMFISVSGPVEIVLRSLANHFVYKKASAADECSRLLAIIWNKIDISLLSYLMPYCWIILVICLLYTNQAAIRSIEERITRVEKMCRRIRNLAPENKQETKKKVSAEKAEIKEEPQRDQIKDMTKPRQSNRIRIRITEIDVKNKKRLRKISEA